MNVIAPLGADVADLARLPEAAFNVVLYPEIAGVAADWLKRTHRQPAVTLPPIGTIATEAFVAEVRRAAGLPEDAARTRFAPALVLALVDSTYLTWQAGLRLRRRHPCGRRCPRLRRRTRLHRRGARTYSREFAREVRAEAARHGLEALITDDQLAVEDAIAALQPELVLARQMERHIAKRLRIPCAVISAPVHVQDFPARYSPQMGAEGANVIFDSWVHPLMMGLEEHLLGMFRDDFEFNDGPSRPTTMSAAAQLPRCRCPSAMPWRTASHRARHFACLVGDAERELKKIPFFVRGKARRNTERFAADKGLSTITIETLYDAKAHYSR